MSGVEGPDPPMRVFAPAKINLDLHLLGRRADGYHELDSLVAFAGVGDWVTAAPGRGLTLSVDGPMAKGVPEDARDNLVGRAALALAEALGRAPDAALRLTKTLPAASGIGGGSADAAAALIALSALWRAELDPAALSKLALGLGADVPVCLGRRAARLTGIGERLSPLPALPRAWLVLVNPGAALSTPAVFAARRGPFGAAPPPLPAGLGDVAALGAALAARRNDLDGAAKSLAPVIDTVLAALADAPGCLLARMSGSGATCFGMFATEARAREAAARLGRAARWWIAAAPLLGEVAAPGLAGRAREG